MASRHTGSAALGRLAAASVRRRRWVLAGWVLFAALVNVVVPQLEQVVASDSTPFVPSDAPAVQAFARMDAAFGTGQAKALAFVVISASGRVDQARATAYYREVVARLRAGHARVADLQEWATHPQLRQALVSKDGRATYIPVAIRHPVGSPEANKDVAWLRHAVAGAPPSVHAYVTGDPATVTDLNSAVQKNISRVTMVTVFIIVVILLLLYRSIVTPVITLGVIGVALLVARGVVSALAMTTHLPVSTYTGTFITAIVLGACTDYTVFIVSRHHEAIRAGQAPREAVVTATRRIGAVITASGATVIIGSACMLAARLALFSTTGPAIAISILATLAVSLTLTPALLAIAGGRAGPRRSAGSSQQRWARVGSLVATRPARVAVTALVLLASLAALYPSMRPSYDTRALEPPSSESDVGYRVLDAHFPNDELRPDYLLVHADHDLRNPRDLAVLDAAVTAVTKVPGVTSVRSATRPQGVRVPQTQLPYALAQVGHRLGAAGRQLRSGTPQVDRLAAGAHRLGAGAGQLSTGTSQAQQAVTLFLAGLAQEHGGLGQAVDGAGRAQTGAGTLRDGAALLAGALRDAQDRTSTAVRYLGTIYTALAADQICTTDPVCNRARAGIHDIWTAERDQLVPGLGRAADAAAAISAGNGRLADGLGQLRSGLARADAGIDQLSAGERQYQAKLGTLAAGAKQLGTGAELLPAGVDSLGTATAQLEHGLDQAAGFLSGTARQTDAAGVDMFWIPASAVNDPRFAASRDYYLSSDGRTARMLVYGAESASRTDAEKQALAAALRRTPLATADVSATGPLAVQNDIRNVSNHDFRLVAAVTLAAVLLVLVLLLRSLVAPLYLLASVVLSYAAAMGVTTLLWQDVLGRPLDFTVPLLAFVILVAVGADYNILLMSRVREESRTATRRGIARAVAATGGVITSAGLIFAGSFIAMTAAPVIGMAEIGFAVATGLVLDTFVVRSLLVPSIAALLGRANWWPGDRRRGAVPPALRGLATVSTQQASLGQDVYPPTATAGERR